MKGHRPDSLGVEQCRGSALSQGRSWLLGQCPSVPFGEVTSVSALEPAGLLLGHPPLRQPSPLAARKTWRSRGDRARHN